MYSDTLDAPVEPGIAWRLPGAAGAVVHVEQLAEEKASAEDVPPGPPSSLSLWTVIS
jgi:hypothetical protein